MYKKILLSLLVIGAIIAFGFIILHGIEKAERAECIKWQGEAEIYQGYYLLDWQKAQCSHYGVELDK